MAEAGRVQAPDLNLRPQLQAAPIVNVSPVSPVNRQGAGSNLMRIAESLGSLTNVMQSYAASTAHLQKTKQTNTDANFVKINAYKTPAQITAAPGYDPTHEPQQVLIGQATANSIGPQLQEWVKNEWDPEKQPDLNTALVGHLQEIQGQMPEPAQAGFGSTIKSSVDETMKWWTGLQTDKNNAAMKQNTFAHFMSLNDLYKDLPVDQRVQKMKEMGLDEYRTLKFTDGKGANNLLMDAVDEFARRGDKDMVRALSTLKRGAKGEIPGLYDMPEYRDRIDAATANADAAWVKTNQVAVGDFHTQADAIVEKGDLNKLTELYNGPVGQKLFPNPAERGDKLRADAAKLQTNIIKNTTDAERNAAVDAQKGTAVNNFDHSNGSQVYTPFDVKAKDGKTYSYEGQKIAQEGLDESIKARYEAVAGDPEKTAALDKELGRKASNSPLKITEWENLFSGALNSSVTNSLLEGKVPPNLQRSYELWGNLKDNPRARKANMGSNADQTDTFFSLVDTFKTAGYGTNEAFVAANEAQPRAGAALGRISEELMGKNSSSYDIRSYPLGIQDQITTRAQAYLASGTMGQEKAVTKALRDFDQETVKIEDFGSRPSFVGVPDKSINKDQFKSSISSFVQNQVAMHGTQQDLPLDIKDVNIFDYGNGRYGLQRDDGEPIPAFFTHRGGAKGAGSMYFTYDDVQRQLQADDAASKGNMSTDAGKMDTYRNNVVGEKPIVPGGGSVGGQVIDQVGSWLKDNIPRPGQPAAPDNSILKGNTGNAEDAYGAKTGNDLRNLSNERLRDVYTLSKQGKLNTSGFVTDNSVAAEYDQRVRTGLRSLGFKGGEHVKDVEELAKRHGFADGLQMLKAAEANKGVYNWPQITSAMTRWSTQDPAEAIRLLKKNNVKPQ